MKLGTNCVEIHTGKYCNAVNNKKNINFELSKIKKTAKYASEHLLEVHAGHGLTYKSIKRISKIKYISEYNIGHFIISEAIFVGLNNAIKKFKMMINN